MFGNFYKKGFCFISSGFYVKVSCKGFKVVLTYFQGDYDFLFYTNFSFCSNEFKILLIHITIFLCVQYKCIYNYLFDSKLIFLFLGY